MSPGLIESGGQDQCSLCSGRFALEGPFDDVAQVFIGEMWHVDDHGHHARALIVLLFHGSTWVVLDGVVEVRRSNEVIGRRCTGSLIGEMSFVGDGPASADVFAIGDVRLRRWEHQRLMTLDQFNPVAGRALHVSSDETLPARSSERPD